MRQKVFRFIKYHLLAAFLLLGLLAVSMGVTWCRYQKTIDTYVNFSVQNPGIFEVIGISGEKDVLEWYQDKETGYMRLDFQIANGTGEDTAAEDSKFILRMITSETISSDVDVYMQTTDSDGIRRVINTSKAILNSGSDKTELFYQNGVGVLYRFWEDGSEKVFELEGGKESFVNCSILVTENVKNFLSEIQVIDASYGTEKNLISGYLDPWKAPDTFLLPEWKAGDAAPETDIYVSAHELSAEGTLVCTTDSKYIIPIFDTVDTNSVVQAIEISAEGNAAQTVTMKLVPQEEFLKTLTEPVVATINIRWTYPVEGKDESETLTAALKLVMHPAVPKPSPMPTISPIPTQTIDPSPSPTSTIGPSPESTMSPSPDPTMSPSPEPTVSPEPTPTISPSPEPTISPSPEPAATITTEETISTEPTATAVPEEINVPEIAMIAEVMEDSTEATEESEETETTESTEEAEDTQTFVISNSGSKQQMAITGIVQQLNIAYFVEEQLNEKHENMDTITALMRKYHVLSDNHWLEFIIPNNGYEVTVRVEELTKNGYASMEENINPLAVPEIEESEETGKRQSIYVVGNHAPAGTYRFVVTQKTQEGLILLNEYFPIFVNYRLEHVLRTETQEDER